MPSSAIQTIFLVTLFAWLSYEYHYKGSFSFDTKKFDSSYTLTDFYFDKGGVAAINVTPVPKNKVKYSLLLCKDEPGDYDDQYHFPDCDLQVDVLDESSETHHGSLVITKRHNYFLYLYLYEGGDSGFNIEITFLNPGNEHLSLNAVPNKYTHTVITIVWLILSVLGTVNCARQKCRLTLALLSYPIVSGAAAALEMAFYFEQSRTGSSRGLYYASKVLTSLSSSVFLFALLVLAQGYGTATREMLRKNWAVVIVVGVVYFFTSFFGSIFGGFYALLSIVVYCVTLYIVFAAATKNIRFFQEHSDIPHAQEKETMFKYLERGLLAYVSCLIIISICNFFTEFRLSEWVPSFLDDVITLGLAAALLYIFRLKKKEEENVYLILEGEDKETDTPAGTQQL